MGRRSPLRGQATAAIAWTDFDDEVIYQQGLSATETVVVRWAYRVSVRRVRNASRSPTGKRPLALRTADIGALPTIRRAR